VRIKANEKIYKWLREHKRYKTVILYGGAGAGKSYTLAQFLLFDIALQLPNKRLLITRKTNPSLRLTTYQLMRDMLRDYQIPHQLLKSEQTVILDNDTRIVFRGMDDPEKIKSAEFNYIWLEEANEFTIMDYQILRMRLRRATKHKNQMYLTFNPVSSWIYKEFFEKEHWDVAKLQVTHWDNPFLDDDYRQILEGLQEEDETLYKIYALGEFAEPKNLIYTKYRIEMQAPAEFDEVIYGLDFGYNNPSVCLRIGIKDREIWIVDELYKTHLTNSDLIELLKTFIRERNAPIYCDSSEPQRIKEIKQAGFNAWPSQKDVKVGIDFVKRQKLHILQHCENTLKEIRTYKWKEDSEGNVLDEPVKFADHAMDALRYAVFTHLEKRGAGRVRGGKHVVKGWW